MYIMAQHNSRRSFTKQFKLDVIAQSYRCDKITELAQDLGLRAELIYRWRSQYRDAPEEPFPGNGVPRQTPEEKELAELKRELAEVRMERDILKKAMGIFTKKSR